VLTVPAPSQPLTVKDCASQTDLLGGVSSHDSIQAALLTGGKDRPYAFGLAMALIAQNVRLDVIGSDEVDSPEMHVTPGLRFLNLHGTLRPAAFGERIRRIFFAYGRLARYAASDSPKVLHILWNNKLELFDRTVLMLYYRLLGKKIAITAHNINAGQRDASDSIVNRITLRIQYRLAHHIFVHTHKMKRQLCEDFGVREAAITTIRHPINNAFPDTSLTPSQAKQRLGIRAGEKTMLFFGRLRPYKGLEYLLSAFEQLSARSSGYRLIVAGESKKGSEGYFEEIRTQLGSHVNGDRIIERIEFIPDEDAELYFKAADVLVLPYKDIFQSGVLFLAYSFGLPVVATDVGSFREEIVEGKTGFVCMPCDSLDLARALQAYFESDLFLGLDSNRREIQEYAYREHSWEAVARLTCRAYEEIVKRKRF
jgi:glycosyltransferase involved in cell wall biosynthesis